MPTGLLSVDILGTCVDFCLRYHENRFLSKMAALRSADPSYVAAKGLQDVAREQIPPLRITSRFFGECLSLQDHRFTSNPQL